MKIIRLKIKRQDSEKTSSYWELFEIKAEGKLAISTLLKMIRKRPITVEGRAVAPVAWDDSCDPETDGSDMMVINGKALLASTTFVHQLDQPICLEPMSKFKVIRDLVVDKNTIYQNFERLRSWMRLDGFYATNTQPRDRITFDDLQQKLSQCTHCGACLEACPQYHTNSKFVGALGISQTYRYQNHPNGQSDKNYRLETLMQSGGVRDCDNAQNCVEVCPVQIPLNRAIGRVKRQVVGHLFWKVFG